MVLKIVHGGLWELSMEVYVKHMMVLKETKWSGNEPNGLEMTHLCVVILFWAWALACRWSL